METNSFCGYYSQYLYDVIEPKDEEDSIGEVVNFTPEGLLFFILEGLKHSIEQKNKTIKQVNSI
jgi:hypothetical protein